MLAFFHTVPQADDYRLTQYHIMPFFDGSWSFKRLWTDVHPNPIHGLILIGSAKWENLSFASLPFLLLPFLFAKWLLAVKAFSVTNPDHQKSSVLIPILCGFGLITFAYNFSGQYYWNSVAIAQIYHTHAAVYILLLALSLARQSWAYPLLLFVAALLFQLTARQYASPWIIATLPVLLLHSLLNRESWQKPASIAVILVAVLLLEKGFLNWFDITLHYSASPLQMLEAINTNWSHRPDELIYHVLAELAYPLINAYNLRFNYDFADRPIEVLMLLAALIMVYCIVNCLLNAKRLDYTIPLILFAYVGLTIIASIAHRTTPDMNWLYGHQPRYDTFRNIAVIATLWVLTVKILQHKRRWLNSSLLIVLISLFCLAQYYQTHYSWDSSKLRTYNKHETAEQIRFVYQQIQADPEIKQETIIDNYRAQTGKRFRLRIGQSDKPGQRWVLNVIQFWGDNQLSVFRQK